MSEVKRPSSSKRPIHNAKETYSYGKRELFLTQKRPIAGVKETYGRCERVRMSENYF
jgi:hypothetical protein